MDRDTELILLLGAFFCVGGAVTWLLLSLEVAGKSQKSNEDRVLLAFAFILGLPLLLPFFLTSLSLKAAGRPASTYDLTVAALRKAGPFVVLGALVLVLIWHDVLEARVLSWARGSEVVVGLLAFMVVSLLGFWVADNVKDRTGSGGWQALITFAGIALGVGWTVHILNVDWSQATMARQGFEGVVGDLVTLGQVTQRHGLAANDAVAPRGGRLVWLDLPSKEIHRDFWKLSADIRATGSHDVAFVCFSSATHRQVGTYSGGDRAFRHEMTVWIVDYKGRRVVRKRDFAADPPQTVARRLHEVRDEYAWVDMGVRNALD